jgi:hypothetical protein
MNGRCQGEALLDVCNKKEGAGKLVDGVTSNDF